MTLLIDRWWAETLVAVEHVPAGAAAEMFRRIAIMLEVLAARSSGRGGSEPTGCVAGL